MADVADDTVGNDGASDSSFNNTLQQTTVTEQAIRSTFLALFLIVGFVGNSVLIATIAQSNRLKGAVLNLSIISIATVNLLECIVNMPLILGASISEKWDYGEFSCRLNAFCVQLVSITMIAGLCIMSVDRLLSVSNIMKYPSRMTVAKTNILIICCWTFGFAISLPIVINVVNSMVYSARYLCSIAVGSSLIYITIVSIVGYLVPILTIFILYVCIIKYSLQGKRRQAHLRDQSEEEQRFDDEVNAAKYVGVLIILWCFFEGPFLLLTSIEQYRNSDELSPIQQVNDILNFIYPWQLDVSFTWLKLSYAIVLPILTFFWRKEVWDKFKNCFICRKEKRNKNKHNKNNTGKNSATNSLNSKNKKKEQLSNGDLSVPVLFATENGLHLQAADGINDESDEGDVFPPDSENNNSSSIASHNLKTRKCDVLGSGFIQQQENEDTSDYDSQGEIDPFSGSNPISIRSKGSQGSHGSIKSTNADKKQHSNSKLGALKEEQSQASEDKNFNGDGKPPNGRKKERKNAQTYGNKDNVESESVRTRSDSGNGSWEKGTGKKKQKNKKRKDHVIEIENDTINSHSTDDIDVKPINKHLANEEDEVIVDESSLKNKKRKKKKKKKKGLEEEVELEGDKDEGIVYENEAYSVVDETIDVVPPRTRQSPKIPLKSETESEENTLFQKVVKDHRELPKPPLHRRLSDDTDRAYILQQRGDFSEGSPQHGAKTERAHMRSLSHDYLLDKDETDNDSYQKPNFRPQPIPRKSKSKLSSTDSQNIENDSSSPQFSAKKHSKANEATVIHDLSVSESENLNEQWSNNAFTEETESSTPQKPNKKKKK